MSAQQLEHYLRCTLEENIALARVGENKDVGIVAVQTFEQTRLVSPYHGLVVHMRDGAEYQLPIVPSGFRR